MNTTKQMCANIQSGIRSARERGEDTTELMKELEKMVDLLLIEKDFIVVTGAIGCNSTERI